MTTANQEQEALGGLPLALEYELCYILMRGTYTTVREAATIAGHFFEGLSLMSAKMMIKSGLFTNLDKRNSQVNQLCKLVKQL